MANTAATEKKTEPNPLHVGQKISYQIVSKKGLSDPAIGHVAELVMANGFLKVKQADGTVKSVRPSLAKAA
jgi:hypothetical protein